LGLWAKSEEEKRMSKVSVRIEYFILGSGRFMLQTKIVELFFPSGLAKVWFVIRGTKGLGLYYFLFKTQNFLIIVSTIFL
jgi:hypothetical protein